MTREEVKVEFTGLAHDHLVAATRVQSVDTSALHHHHHRHNHSHNVIKSRRHHHLNNQQQQQHYIRNQHQQNNHNNNSNNTSNQQQHVAQNNHSLAQPLGCINNIPAAHEVVVPAHTETSPEKVIANEATQPVDVAAPAGDNRPVQTASALSTIAILRRHPMYDSLVLVKKYRACLDGYSLEFPTSSASAAAAAPSVVEQIFNPRQRSENNDIHRKRKAVDEGGQDHSCNELADVSECNQPDCGRTKLVSVYLDGDDPIYQSQAAQSQAQRADAQDGDVVYVPINGLLDRLENYDRHGVAIDSCVYAFAMGLKTAERILTSSTEKEIQETPPL